MPCKTGSMQIYVSIICDNSQKVKHFYEKAKKIAMTCQTLKKYQPDFSEVVIATLIVARGKLLVKNFCIELRKETKTPRKWGAFKRIV